MLVLHFYHTHFTCQCHASVTFLSHTLHMSMSCQCYTLSHTEKETLKGGLRCQSPRWGKSVHSNLDSPPWALHICTSPLSAALLMHPSKTQRRPPPCTLQCVDLGIFREHSGNIQGTFREHSGKIQGKFTEHSGNTLKTQPHPAGVRLAGCGPAQMVKDLNI